MRKMLFVLILLAGFINAQVVESQKSDTLANSGSYNVYFYSNGGEDAYLSALDLNVVYSGEIDVDHIILYGGTMNGNTFVSAATLKDSTITVNNADGTATAIKYTGTAMGFVAGYEVYKVSFTMASSGNASTDAGNTYDNFIICKGIKQYTH